MRKLSLKADRLAELTSEQLERVAAGEETRVCIVTDPCITQPQTGVFCLTRQPACT